MLLDIGSILVKCVRCCGEIAVAYTHSNLSNKKKDEMRRKRDREQVKGSIQIQLSIDELVWDTVFTQIILWVGDRCISFSPYTYFFLSFSIFLLLIVVVAVPLLLLLFCFVLTFLHFSLHASLWQIYCIRIV